MPGVLVLGVQLQHVQQGLFGRRPVPALLQQRLAEEDAGADGLWVPGDDLRQGSARAAYSLRWTCAAPATSPPSAAPRPGRPTAAAILPGRPNGPVASTTPPGPARPARSPAARPTRRATGSRPRPSAPAGRTLLPGAAGCGSRGGRPLRWRNTSPASAQRAAASSARRRPGRPRPATSALPPGAAPRRPGTVSALPDKTGKPPPAPDWRCATARR